MVHPSLAVAGMLLCGGVVYALVRPATEDVPDDAVVVAAADDVEQERAQVAAQVEANLAAVGKAVVERREAERRRLAARWDEVLALEKAGKVKEALAAARRLKADVPSLFEDPEKAAALDRLAIAVEAAGKRAELEKLLAVGRLSPEQRAAVNAKLAATAEVLAKSANEDDLDQLSRHLRRFLLPNAPLAATASGDKGPPSTADAVMGAFLADRRARRGKDTNPPVADVDEAERRRVDQLDKLRQRNAVGLLDAIHAGLAWLALHQGDDGSISDATVGKRCSALKHDPACLAQTQRADSGDAYRVATTALTALAFLDFRDQDPNGWFDPYLGRAIEWLRKAQQPNGGWNAAGNLYASAMALMALGQAAGSTGSPETRDAVRKGLAYFEAAMSPLGGYRYRPLDPQGDLSVTAWVVQAVEAARAAGIEIPYKVASGIDLVLTYFWIGDHRFTYLPGGGVSHTLAPAGMLVGHVAGRSSDPAIAASWREYLKSRPANRPPNLYTLYYGVRLSILLDGALEDPWRAWAFDVAKAQVKSGPAAGAIPVVVHNPNRASGLATETALAVLTLEHALYLR